MKNSLLLRIVLVMTMIGLYLDLRPTGFSGLLFLIAGLAFLPTGHKGVQQGDSTDNAQAFAVVTERNIFRRKKN